MTGKDKVCRHCKLFVEGNTTKCPICDKAEFSRTWKGVVFINDPANSEVAKIMDIKAPGKYCLWVK